MERLPQVLVEDIAETWCKISSEIHICFQAMEIDYQINILCVKTSNPSADTHLIRAQTRDPDILLGGEPLHGPKPYSYLRTLELGSSEFKQSNIMPKHDQRPCFITGSCDGLVCVYHVPNFIYLVNPATRWCRPLPKAKFQKINRIRRSLDSKLSLSFA
ncbi:hypothetical protein F2Q69_00049509 [Brassica cretica]|uniref:Uncharacterized protein n=1 Tax=Brassica cretica TaxID=69181 RepID=A0A8S9Q1A4_BRACR|nr:hypothetical protein F2Q69_00049509 [Brassica cretica]